MYQSLHWSHRRVTVATAAVDAIFFTKLSVSLDISGPSVVGNVVNKMFL